MAGEGRAAQPGRAASVFDVAKAAGVSHQTVSRVLNDHPNVRTETRQKVLDAMERLAYRPNFAARTLSSSRSRIIGILSTANGEYGPASTIAAVEAASRAKGYSVTIANADGHSKESVAEAIEVLRNVAAEGIVVVAPQAGVLEALEAAAVGIPHVTTQTLVRHGEQDLAAEQVAGARAAVAHLAELGHRRIGHLAGPGDWIDARSRLEGFRAEMAARGLDADAVAHGDWSAAAGYAAAPELLDRGVTAVFSANDQMALGMLHAAFDAGLDVPRDLSVVGFDDAPESAHYRPPLTTVRQRFDEVGRLAVARLLGEPEGSAPPAAPPAPPPLLVRGSTAPRPAVEH
ncbi:LacI family DNA-binding transcriptional regulator [Herbiconiux moechotypicola]|uniref:LacI family DNA-binding transcriptional regulator n=2 Tax=Herbiconiux moechotypicola TaxID=637393 RepID=A0ABN3DJ01_9MICO